mgnify:CR=1 FL=1
MSLISFFKNYLKLLIPLLLLTLAANGIGLFIPKIIGQHIDYFQATGAYSNSVILVELLGITLLIIVFTLLQSALASYTSEKIAYDIRELLAQKIAGQSFHYVSTITVPKILTIITSDVDGVKGLVSQGIVAIFSAVLILLGTTIALLSIHLQLALITLAVIPFLAIAFIIIFGKIGALFKASQENLEKINKVVNESIIAASLVRVLNSENYEVAKFDEVNIQAKNIGLNILKGFASLIPIINLATNATLLLILWFGGTSVVRGELSFGSFSAFFAYSSMLIMPIFIIAFISNSISRAFISWKRIQDILTAPLEENSGSLSADQIQGAISFDHVSLSYNDKQVLKDISFTIKPGTKNALIGPVSAGKTQILYLLAGLIQPKTGTIKIDEVLLPEYDRNKLLRHMGFVFQDSLILNATLRENIQLHEAITDQDMEKAIATAQLNDLIESLPQGLETTISERGSNLSGGQKQRLMLARALALNPKILLLDDFTARVDRATEQSIIAAIEKNYPNITLVSITQKVDPIKEYDLIIVVMEGELIASGRHEELLENSLEYRQICESQKTSA